MYYILLLFVKHSLATVIKNSSSYLQKYIQNLLEKYGMQIRSFVTLVNHIQSGKVKVYWQNLNHR
eukprot:UN08802